MTYKPYDAKTAVDLDNAGGDAFGRLRVASPRTLFDSKQTLDNQPVYWDEALESGAGVTSSWSKNLAATTISSTASTAGLFTRRTRQRFNYEPGKSQMIMMTGVLAPTAGAAGLTRRIGMFDDNNGLYFADIDGGCSVVRRSNTTGSPVETVVPQASWNTDPMDGTGPSGVTADWSLAQIFVIDFEWLGLGRVRFGLVVDGVTHYVHEMNHANSLAGVYMSTPNLPLTYQLEQTAAAPAADLVHVCTTVISEGGSQIERGLLRYSSTEGAHIDMDAADTLYPAVGIRLKATHYDAVVRVKSVTVNVATNDDVEWVLLFNPTIASGPPSWAGVTDSAIETALGDGTMTVTGSERQINGGFLQSDTSLSEVLDEQRQLGQLIDGTVDEIWLAIRPLSTNLDVDAGVTWHEVA